MYYFLILKRFAGSVDCFSTLLWILKPVRILQTSKSKPEILFPKINTLWILCLKYRNLHCGYLSFTLSVYHFSSPCFLYTECLVHRNTPWNNRPNTNNIFMVIKELNFLNKVNNLNIIIKIQQSYREHNEPLWIQRNLNIKRTEEIQHILISYH